MEITRVFYDRIPGDRVGAFQQLNVKNLDTLPCTVDIHWIEIS